MSAKLFLGALVLTSSLFATPQSPCEETYDVCCEEAAPGPFAFSYPWDRDLACPVDFYLHASFLLWQAKEDGLEFAIDSLNGHGFPVRGDVNGFTSDTNSWHWNPGIRVGIGFYLTHDVWDLSLTYTGLNITDSRSFDIQSGVGQFEPLWLAPNVQSTNTNRAASAQWKTYYGIFDLTLGKPHHVSRYFTMNPFFGIRAGWIDQYYLARYAGLFGSGLGAQQDGAEMRAHNDFWGIGIRGGVDVNYILGRNLTIFARMAGSMLRGHFHIDQETDVTTSGSINSPTGYELDDDFMMNVPNIDMILGIGWGMFFNDQKQYFGLELAWEHQHWWDQNNLRRFWGSAAGFVNAPTSSNDTISKGDLAFNGVNFKIFCDF